MKSEIKFEDNSLEVLKELNATSEQLLYLIGTECVAGAVDSISNENLAVDTGRLRASISFVTASEASGAGAGGSPENPVTAQDLASAYGNAPEDTVIIGTNVNYASYVHNGTAGYPQGRPFLKDGIEKAEPIIGIKARALFEGKK